MVYNPDDSRVGGRWPFFTTALVAVAVGAVLVIIIAVVRLLSPLDHGLTDRIEEDRQQGAARGVPIRRYTDFAWDRVCIFGPDVTTEEVDAVIGTEWGRASGDLSGMRDLLVFLRDGDVVRAAQLRRAILPAPPPEGECRTPAEAVTTP